MSRRRPADRRPLIAGLVLLTLAAGAVRAQPPETEEIPLTAPVRRSLALLQQDWAEWLSAFARGDVMAMDESLERLQDGLSELGMERLPELSVGAAAEAVQAASRGRLELAHSALEAASALDPGRPEAAAAAAWLARSEGRRFGALAEAVRAWGRILGMPFERAVLLHDALLWVLFATVLATALFVVVMMAARGPRLVAGLADVLTKWLPAWIALALAVAILLWPIVLPGGFFWLLLYWSVLLWTYSAVRERVILVLAWVLLAATPILVNGSRRLIAVHLSPMVRALEDAAAGRLQGDLFEDLASLRAVLPGSPAVLQVLADQHRRLGQCEYARPLYSEVLRQERDNAAAVLGLGVCAFERGDLEEAIDRFRRAAALDPRDAAAPYDLSLVHAEVYQFDRARDALSRAQRLSSESVARWISRGGPPRPAAVDGGFRRLEEIRRDLVRSWALEDEGAQDLTPWRGLVSLPLAVACLLAALVFSALAPQPRRFIGAPRRLPRSAEILRRTLLPGLAETWEGETFSAFAALWVAAALLSLLLIGRFGLRLPLGLESPVSWIAWLGWGGLAVLVLLRWRGAARAV